MPQEGHNHGGSTASSGGGGNTGSFGRSSRKQKKVPQRGLGVAQLEKIRIEELRKNDAGAAAPMAPNAILPPMPSAVSQATDVLELVRQSDTVVMHGNIQKVWNSANLGSELGTTVIDPTYARPSNWNPQGEPDPIWPPPAGPIPMVQLEYLNQVHAAVQSAPTSSSSSSSSLLNYPIEPPSNQNYHHSCYRPINAEVVGIKRPHPWTPFSLENPPPPPPLRPRTAHHAGLMNESISLGSGSRSIHDPGSGNFSVSFSASSSAQDSKSTRGSRENGNLGEVLTLAPPSTSSTWPNQRLTDPSPALASKNQNNFHVLEPHHLYQELSDFQQGSTWPGEQQQQHYHNFLAPAISQDAQADTSSKPGNGEHQEPIDLELRL
ncbi:uncharacterized protein LOC116214805 isoform X2 [Punica granatum]|uniref:Uncharacterized protein LOC116214805 isoform X2 n=1 Tax=Punica granatum TaxID=22663 RepID=A0A6P8E812_PUNGR|nr:uncharacterized protein LOC116214805 isoform X2 [Punica granatum]